MKSRSRKDARLKQKFEDVKDFEGIMPDNRIREERRVWKRAISKHSRRLDRDAISDGLEAMNETD